MVAPSRELAMQIVRVAQVRGAANNHRRGRSSWMEQLRRQPAAAAAALHAAGRRASRTQPVPAWVLHTTAYLAVPSCMQSLLPDSARRGVQQAIGGANIWRQRDALKVCAARR